MADARPDPALLARWKADPGWTIEGSPGPGFVPVRFKGGAFERAVDDALADNEIGKMSEWDREVLGKVLAERQRQEGNLAALASSTAFSEAAIADLVRQASGRPAPKDDKPPPAARPPRAPVSQPGELYELGPHRLLCGDSTRAEHVARLMGGELADAVFTDPPFAIYGSSSGLSASITDDKIVRPFFRDVLIGLEGHVRVYGHVYVCCDWRSYPSWWEVSKLTGLAVKNLIVWDKGNSGLGNNYGNTHELIVFFARWPVQKVMSHARAAGARQVLSPNMLRHAPEGDAGPVRVELVDVEGLEARAGELAAQAVKEGRQPDEDDRARAAALLLADGATGRQFVRYGRVLGRDRLHNAAKPIPLIEELVVNSTDDGGLVLDLFGGSGTSMIACARTGRRARLMEVDAAWCDVIRARWTRWATEAQVPVGDGGLHLEEAP